MTKISSCQTSKNLKYPSLRIFGVFFDEGILAYFEEKKPRRCVKLRHFRLTVSTDAILRFDYIITDNRVRFSRLSEGKPRLFAKHRHLRHSEPCTTVGAKLCFLHLGYRYSWFRSFSCNASVREFKSPVNLLHFCFYGYGRVSLREGCLTYFVIADFKIIVCIYFVGDKGVEIPYKDSGCNAKGACRSSKKA